MKRNNAFVLRNIKTVYILVPTQKNNVGLDIFHLNEVGAYIWNCLESCLSVDILVQNTAQHFGVENNQEDRESIRYFVRQLAEIGLCQI